MGYLSNSEAGARLGFIKVAIRFIFSKLSKQHHANPAADAPRGQSAAKRREAADQSRCFSTTALAYAARWFCQSR